MSVSPLLKQLLRRTGVLFLIFLAASILPTVVTFPAKYEDRISTALSYIAIISFFLQAILWVNALVTHWTTQYINRHQVHRSDLTTIQAVAAVARVAAGAILLILAFEALGKNVTGLVAGLGIGGIAIAFALQNVLSDLFGAFSIVLDKPFVLGDAIQVDTFSGTVERIGLKSTRVRSDDGEEIVFANGELLKGRLRNFGRMEERRAVFATRVTAATPPDVLARIPSLIQEIIETHPDIRFGRSHLKTIGDATIDFESVYYLKNTAYKFFMDTQQSVTLALIRRCAQGKIELAAQLETAVKQYTAGRQRTATEAEQTPS
jgi:small-conductance mechanosensitive channel